MTTVSPVIILAAGLKRKTAKSASSLGSINLLIRCRFKHSSFWAGTDVNIGVSTPPGHMQFTRILCGASSTAIVFVRFSIAALVAEYMAVWAPTRLAAYNRYNFLNQNNVYAVIATHSIEINWKPALAAVMLMLSYHVVWMWVTSNLTVWLRKIFIKMDNTAGAKHSSFYCTRSLSERKYFTPEDTLSMDPPTPRDIIPLATHCVTFTAARRFTLSCLKNI